MVFSNFLAIFAPFSMNKCNFYNKQINYLNMKKNLFTGMAAILFCGVFTSCSHEVNFDASAIEQNYQLKYEEAFKSRFGNPSPDQTWGFGASAQARTRATNSAPAPTNPQPTFNAQLAQMSDNLAQYAGYLNADETSHYMQFKAWWNSGWADTFYEIDAKPVFSTYGADYLSQVRDLLATHIPEGQYNYENATAAGYTITTTGGPVTLTPIYHDSSSGDLISYYYYPKGQKPSVEQIKKMKKYTVGYMADPQVVKQDGQHTVFYQNTFSLVYVDAQGNASYDFPKDIEINFIISNVDLAHNPDLSIFDRYNGNGTTTKKALGNYPEFYGDGDLNETIHTSNLNGESVGIGQWSLPTAWNPNVTNPKMPHAAVFSINGKNYVGFEDWTDFDYNDVIFEVRGTEGGTTIEDGDEWDEIRVIAEDLQVGENTDFDFNDVVFDVYRYKKTTKLHNEGEVWIILQAAGGTLPLYVAGYEVHDQFQVPVNEMVNTNAQARGLSGADRGPVAIQLTSDQYSGSTIGEIANSIEIRVKKKDAELILQAPVGAIASKIGVGCDFEWCNERQDIDNKYKLTNGNPLFKQYVQGILPDNGWYQYAYDNILLYKPAF